MPRLRPPQKQSAHLASEIYPPSPRLRCLAIPFNGAWQRSKKIPESFIRPLLPPSLLFSPQHSTIPCLALLVGILHLFLLLQGGMGWGSNQSVLIMVLKQVYGCWKTKWSPGWPFFSGYFCTFFFSLYSWLLRGDEEKKTLGFLWLLVWLVWLFGFGFFWDLALFFWLVSVGIFWFLVWLLACFNFWLSPRPSFGPSVLLFYSLSLFVSFSSHPPPPLLPALSAPLLVVATDDEHEEYQIETSIFIYS